MENSKWQMSHCKKSSPPVPGISVREGPNFVTNPATGALELTPDGFLKTQKAIMREVRRGKFRLYLAFARFYLKKFLLECRGACLKVIGNLARQF